MGQLLLASSQTLRQAVWKQWLPEHGMTCTSAPSSKLQACGVCGGGQGLVTRLHDVFHEAVGG